MFIRYRDLGYKSGAFSGLKCKSTWMGSTMGLYTQWRERGLKAGPIRSRSPAAKWPPATFRPRMDRVFAGACAGASRKDIRCYKRLLLRGGWLPGHVSAARPLISSDSPLPSRGNLPWAPINRPPLTIVLHTPQTHGIHLLDSSFSSH